MTLVYLAAAWVVGITLAAVLALPAHVWLWLLVLPLGYLVLWWRDVNLRRVHFIFLALILGALRFQLAVPSSSDQNLAQFNDQGRASLIGVVMDEPDQRDAYTNLRVDVTKIQRGADWQNTHGYALVQAPRDTPVHYGDEIQVDGEPSTPPAAADFSYRDFLARESIFTTVRRARVYVISPGHGNPILARLFEFKTAGLNAVATLFPEPSVSLLQGILLGNDQGIPRALKDAFSQTNTAHIIAISGFNIGILAIYLGKISKRVFAFRPTLADGFVIGALIVYTMLVGADASVVRAAIMGILSIIALRYGRQALALNSLAVAALIMTLLNPYTLWDVGFQLSFLATLGLLLYTQSLARWSERMLGRITNRAKQIVAFLSDSFIVTLAAWFTTTPLIVAIFHRVSLVGLLTNLLILPVQPPIMILGGLATLVQMLAMFLAPIPFASTIIGAIAQVLAWGAYVFLQYTILVVQWTAQVPFGSFEVPRIDWALVILAYLCIFVVTRWSLKRLTGLFFSRPAWAAGLLAFISVFVWTSTLAAPDPRTHMQFIATSGGDAIFIRTANGARILIDGSAEPSALLGHLGNQMTFWDSHLDLVIVTNLDEQNLASLNAVAERFTIGQVVEPPVPDYGGVSYKRWRALLAQKAVPSTEARAGAHWQVDEVTFDVFSPDDVSGNIALRGNAGSHLFLLAPSLSAKATRVLTVTDTTLLSEFAVLPNEFDQELLKRVAPRVVVFFVGKSSRAQPMPETLKLLGGVNVWRTDERGTIEFIFDGDEVQISVER